MFQLMLKDKVQATFEITPRSEVVTNLKIYGRLPLGCEPDTLGDWLSRRRYSSHRKQITKSLLNAELCKLSEFLRLTHGVSFDDSYWVQEKQEGIRWNTISPYCNRISSSIAPVLLDVSVPDKLKLSDSLVDICTTGSSNKCWNRESSGMYLYKSGDASNPMGSYCEVLASQVYKSMDAGIGYSLFQYMGITVSRSRLFTSDNISFAPFRYAGGSKSKLKDILDFYDSIGQGEQIRRILVCDAIVLNIDRNPDSHGVLYDSGTGEIKGMAPGFNYNMSLISHRGGNKLSPEIKNDIETLTPYFGGDFIEMARNCLTDSIRKDLLDLQGIQLELPFVNEDFTVERLDWAEELVNERVDRILGN